MTMNGTGGMAHTGSRRQVNTAKIVNRVLRGLGGSQRFKSATKLMERESRRRLNRRRSRPSTATSASSGSSEEEVPDDQVQTTVGLAPDVDPKMEPGEETASKRARYQAAVQAKEERDAELKPRTLPPMGACVTPCMPAGELFTWGLGSFGQLGQRERLYSSVPQPVEWASELEMRR